MKVLIVEDDLQMQEVLNAILCRCGFEVRLAADGKRALSIVDQFDPDWIVTDLLMPEMDGLETIMAMRCRRTRARIVAMSGSDWPCAAQCMRSAVRFGAEAVLIKPFETRELLEILEQS